MKKRHVVSRILVLCLGIGIAVADGLHVDDFTGYSLPDIMPAWSATRADIDYSNQVVTGSSFYPIGWSRNGKFAYVFEYVAEGLGEPVREYNIQDMVSDESVYAKMQTGVDAEPLPAEFLDTCEEVGISLNGAELSLFPMIVGDLAYSAHLEGFFFVEDGHFFGDNLEQYLVRMFRSDGTTKVIHQYLVPRTNLYDVRILGCFRSPFENRVAVALCRISYGHEASLATSVHFVGSHLSYGFEPYGLE